VLSLLLSFHIFFSTVRLLAPYGMHFSAALGCLGFCLVGWLICLLVGVEDGTFLPFVVPLERKKLSEF
jgi:hypothetical protein